MSAATTRSRTPDRLCAEAVDLARAAAQETAAPGSVGEHVSLVPEGDRVVTHFFDCSEPGYRGWRWAVTVARASRAKNVTVDESVLLPGPDALLAPEWVPWSERLRPGDLGPGDLLPTAADDPRLEPGYTGEDVPPPNSVIAETSHDLAERVEAEDAELTDRTPADAAGNSRGEIAALAEELGMRRRARRAGSWCRSRDRCGRRSGSARTSSLRRTGGSSRSPTAAEATPRPPLCRSRRSPRRRCSTHWRRTLFRWTTRARTRTWATPDLDKSSPWSPGAAFPDT